MDFTDITTQLDRMPGMVRAHSQEPFWQLSAHHHIKVRFKKFGGSAIFGRNGLRAAIYARFFENVPTEQMVLRVGDFTDFAGSLTLLLGGEHNNHKAINHLFNNMPFFRDELNSLNIEKILCHSNGPISIGSNVVISMNAVIRSGVTIGDGAVIGAGAVVVKDVPPFAIVAGNPAKIIRYRFDEETIEALLKIRWWHLTFDSLRSVAPLLDRIHEPDARAALLQSPLLKYENPKDFLVYEMDGEWDKSTFTVAGIERNGIFTPAEQAPKFYQFFFTQLNNTFTDGTYVIHDVFGMYDRMGASAMAAAMAAY